MNSMTGYGFKETIVDETQVSVEIKSVNSRFLDLSVSVPPFLSPLENRVRSILSESVSRGKIEVYVRVKDFSSAPKIVVDKNAALAYRDALLEVANAVGANAEIPLSLIVSQDGVLSVSHEYDLDLYWKKIEPIFREVLAQFLADRKREGENLKKDLLEKLSILENCLDFFKKSRPVMETRFKEIISTKFKELLGENVDENRIMTEVAAMLVRYTINEEIIRLESHLNALKDEIKTNPLPGKRLDFICQEANREINTIGSKNQFADIGAMVVNAKDALENIREQSKNVE